MCDPGKQTVPVKKGNEGGYIYGNAPERNEGNN